MSIWKKLKKLFVDEPLEDKDEKPKVEIIYDSKNEHSALTVEPRSKPQIEEMPRSIEVQDTGSAIKNWENTLKAAQQHPLTQAKIINTQILEELSNVLKSMDLKQEKYLSQK